MADLAPVCVRCGRPVEVSREWFEVFERMHWVCFHYEFEHDGDPDAPCADLACPTRPGPDAPPDLNEEREPPLLESSRSFAVWRYSVSHKQLLLRSVKSEQEPTRIDVLFKPVRAMRITATFEGLLVRAATPAEAAAVDHRPEESVFILSASDFDGYVVAMTMATAEDIGGYNDPSSFEFTGP